MPTQPVVDRLLGLTASAMERGDSVLHLQIDVAALSGEASSWGSAGSQGHADDTVGQFLSHIETLGWRLEHTGYSFVETGSSSSARIFGTGEGRVNLGVVLGFFTFRRVSPVAG